MDFIKLFCLLSFLFVCCLAGPRDFVKECTDEKFIQGVAICVLEKFTAILPYSEMSYDTSFIGRKTLEFHEPMDSPIRDNFVAPMISDRLSDVHRNLLNNLEEVSKAAVHKEYEALAMEKLKHINFQQLIHEYIAEVLSHVTPLTHHVTLMQEMIEETGCSETCLMSPQFCTMCVQYNSEQQNLTSCLAQFTADDFEDNIQWVKCFYKCDDLIPISHCMEEHFSQCGKWSVLSDVMIKGFATFTELDSCHFKVEGADSLALVEGGEPAYVDISLYMPPGAYCVDFSTLTQPLGMLSAIGSMIQVILGNTPACKVEVQLSLQNFWDDLIPAISNPLINIGKPKCMDKKAIRQAVIGYHEWSAMGDNTCIINVTSSNWNATHTIPIWPSVDLKVDGNVETNLTMKLMVNRRVQTSVKIPVTIEDKDNDHISLCMSAGDPHLLTFDAHYYNNLYDGFFYLYKNTKHPYQIQTVYQRCTSGGNASCTCAVAIQSGDDVIVVDKCRKKGQNSVDTQMKALVYVNGALTAGTRVFRRSKGAEFRVILPTGMRIDITTYKGFLNVYVTPSNYDWENTEGLCGTYTGNKTDDLRLPDGTMYTGPGTGQGEQPRDFSKAWRVPPEEQIFNGIMAGNDTGITGPFCRCSHVLLVGVECVCGHGEMVETCDYDLSGELYELTALTRQSKKSQGDSNDIDMTNVDIDNTFEPADLTWDDNTEWSLKEAETVCTELIDKNDLENKLLRDCRGRTGLGKPHSYQYSVEQCLQDIDITDTDDWKWAAVETAKRICMGDFLLGINLADPSVQNYTCLNDCTDRGTCLNGVCTCEDGWTGGDCSLAPGATTVTMQSNSKCDSRHENCTFATVFGTNFPYEKHISCKLYDAWIDIKSGKYGHNNRLIAEVEIIYVSNYQVVCRLPQGTKSYYITLMIDNQPVTQAENGFSFLSYDAACYSCDSNSLSCTEKSQDQSPHCIIDNHCYSLNQTNPTENCQFCNGKAEWDWFESDVCQEKKNDHVYEIEKADRDKIIRISVACILTALIIILTIVAYMISKRKSANEDKPTEKIEEKDHENAYDNIGYTVHHEKSAYTNLTITVSAPEDDKKTNQGNPISSPRLQQVKNMDDQYRARTDSAGSRSTEFLAAKMKAKEMRKNQEHNHSISTTHSVKSHGIGGGGPVTFTQYHCVGAVDDDVGHHHLDKGMGAHATPPLTKKPYDHTSVTTWF